MYERVEKPKENKSRAVANSVAQKKSKKQQGFGFVDNREKTIMQMHLENGSRIYEGLGSQIIQRGCGMSQEAEGETTKTAIEKLKEEYDKQRYYHGTSEEHQNSIRQHGMTQDKKGEGATKVVEGKVSEVFKDNAKRHHFMTQDKKQAASYANTQTHGSPRLVRVVAPNATLELDPDSGKKNTTAFRTSDEIPMERIRKSKALRFTDLSKEVQQDLMKSAGVAVDGQSSYDFDLSDSNSDSDEITRAPKMGV